MRDANAMQLSLNQIDLNVNAEMQLGKNGCWLNYSEGCQLVWRYNINTSQVNTLSVRSSDLVDLILVFCSRENDVAAVSYVSVCIVNAGRYASFSRDQRKIHPIRANREVSSYHSGVQCVNFQPCLLYLVSLEHVQSTIQVTSSRPHSWTSP